MKRAWRAALVGCVGWAAASAAGGVAHTQGVPAWAPESAADAALATRAADGGRGPAAAAGGLDAGGAGNPARVMTAFRNTEDAGKNLEFLVRPLEFLLGFNPLERAPAAPPGTGTRPSADGGYVQGLGAVDEEEDIVLVPPDEPTGGFVSPQDAGRAAPRG